MHDVFEGADGSCHVPRYRRHRIRLLPHEILNKTGFWCGHWLVSEGLHITIPFFFRKALQGGLLTRKGLMVFIWDPRVLHGRNVFFISSRFKPSHLPRTLDVRRRPRRKGGGGWDCPLFSTLRDASFPKCSFFRRKNDIPFPLARVARLWALRASKQNTKATQS